MDEINGKAGGVNLLVCCLVCRRQGEGCNLMGEDPHTSQTDREDYENVLMVLSVSLAPVGSSPDPPDFIPESLVESSPLIDNILGEVSIVLCR